ncbi:His/Gly/Thr/Pro-type tRNA ligase C-terminal domain-containing protein [Nocardioides convexus]
MPTIVTVGRGVADPENQVIEVKDRRTGEKQEIALDGAVEAIRTLVEG